MQRTTTRFWCEMSWLYHPVLRPIRNRFFVALGLVRRAMTLGVRGIVRNQKGEVLLVRHTYVAGWHLPGGGVERNQSMAEAMHEELAEEVNITATGPIELFQIYRNPITSRFDHVALYVVPHWTGTGTSDRDWEIAETGFFALDALPEGTTKSTRQRLLEVSENKPVSQEW